MSCVVWSPLVRMDGVKMEGVLTVIDNIKNNDERRHSRCSLFGCHLTESDMAPVVAACWWVVVLGAGRARGWSLAFAAVRCGRSCLERWRAMWGLNEWVGVVVDWWWLLW